MEKLRKIADWVLRNKELVALVVLLAILAYRGYSIWRPEAEDVLEFPPRAKAPDKNWITGPDGPGEPSPPPIPSERLPIEGLAKANPFTTLASSSGGNRNGENSERPDLKVVGIQKWKDGTYRAEIVSKQGVRPKRYKESEEFESYRIEKIDPETKTVTIYSEEHRQNFDFKVGR